MDPKLLARTRYLLGPLLALLFLIANKPAAAQNGACPSNTYYMGSVAGSWPDNLRFCSPNPAHTFVVSEPQFACGQQVRSEVLWTPDELPDVYIVPHQDQYYGGLGKFKALIWAYDASFIFDWPIYGPGNPLQLPEEATVRIAIFDSNSNLLGIRQYKPSWLANVDTYIDDALFGRRYYRVYLIDTFFDGAIGGGGFFHVSILWDDPSFGFQPPDGFYLASVQVGHANQNFPDHCPIPNAVLPGTPTPPVATFTPPATWTPDPVITPSATPTFPLTPEPTDIGGTPIPSWTETPYTFVTVPAESTPTPWPPYLIPTIDWPTRGPGSTPMAAAATIEIIGSELITIQDTINDDWSTPLAFGQQWGSDDPNNTGIEQPSNIVADILSLISYPISYAKGAANLMPNSAPYIALMLVLAAWIPFNMLAKFGLAIAARLFELIRRLLELIPGM